MATFNESLTRIRRFLRDPSAKIWSTDLIRRAWNEAQLEIFQKVGLIEEVGAYPYPPQYTYGYIHDWEYAFAEGDRYQALELWQANATSVCWAWEPVYWVTEAGPDSGGARFTIPFEVNYLEPCDYVPFVLHAQFHKAKYAAWDETPITSISQKELNETDWNYRNTTGTPQYYWRPDQEQNQFVLYPRPSSITWQEEEVGDTFSDTLGEGLIAWSEDSVDQADTGMITGTIDAAGAVLMVYERLPYDVIDDDSTWDDTLDLPEYVIHYIEAGTLERAFSADNDGFIPTLRDFWKLRKEIGINALKTYKRNRLKNRDYVIGTARRHRIGSKLRLPSSYPRS